MKNLSRNIKFKIDLTIATAGLLNGAGWLYWQLTINHNYFIAVFDIFWTLGCAFWFASEIEKFVCGEYKE